MTWDCSELTEAASLLQALMPTAEVAPSGDDAIPLPASSHARVRAPEVTPPPQAAPEPVAVPEPVVSTSPYRGERLEELLRSLCARAGLDGAVVADVSGLPLAAADSPVKAEHVAALCSVLGESLRQAEALLGGQQANNISVDFNYADKLVLRQFQVDGGAFYLALICPQDVEVREEIELTLEQIVALLSVG